MSGTNYTFTITTEPLIGSGEPAQVFEFLHISDTIDERYALDFKINAPIRNLIRYHPRGVVGNITIRDQTSGRPMVLTGKICKTLADARADFKAIAEACRAYSCEITDPTGIKYPSCNLVDARMLDTLPDGTTDEEENVELDVEFTFTQDRDY